MGYITTKQAAEKMGLNQRHVSRLVRQGKLSGQKFGRDWMVEEESIKRYLENRPKPGPQPGKQ